jgi:hypothetical protein
MMITSASSKKIVGTFLVATFFMIAAPSAQAIALPPLAGTISADVGPIAKQIAKCVQQDKKLQEAAKSGWSAIKNFFGGGGSDTGDVTGNVTGDTVPDPGGTPTTLDTSTTSTIDTGSITGGGTVPVSDAAIQKTVDQIQKTTKAIEEAVSVSSKTDETQDSKNCWLTIERMAAQIVLKEITKSTLNWINSGFHGKPAYIQDPGAFLAGIRKQTIGDFTGAIAYDSVKYPFGKIVAQGLINDTQDYFEKSAQYSLDNVIAEKVPGATHVDFQQNFANGSWDAFGAQFSTNNNPIGFNLSAQSELSKRIQDTGYSKAQDIKDQIQRNQGFLDDKLCVDPANSDLEFPDTRCRKWETQTPGSVIVSKLNDTLGSPMEQLSLGKDITTDMIAIINALLNQGVKYSLKNTKI